MIEAGLRYAALNILEARVPVSVKGTEIFGTVTFRAQFKSTNIFIPVLFFIITLSLHTIQKTTFIWLLRIHSQQDISFEASYVAVGSLILLPYIWSVFQMYWNIPLLTKVKGSQLPPLKYVLLGIVAAIIESAAIVAFTTVVATSLPVYVLLPLMGSVLSVSFLSHAIVRGTENVGVCSQATCGKINIIWGILAAVAPFCAALVLCLFNQITWLQALIMCVSLTAMATVWSPRLQIRTLMTKDGLKRIHFIYAILKIIGVILFLFLKIYIMNDSMETVEDILIKFQNKWTGTFTWKIMIPLVSNILSGLAAEGFLYLSIAYCTPFVGILASMLLATPTCIVLCVTVLSPMAYHVDELKDFGESPSLIIVASISSITWAVPYVLKICQLIKRTPNYLFMPYETLFLSYGWNSLFFDQKLLLSYNADVFNSVSSEDTSGTNSSSIYVCTTMYREDDYEVERLLRSLQRLSQSTKLKLEDVHIEANIFMDNGCSGRELKEFAQQLVSLLITKFSMTLVDCPCFETPYGLQLRYILDGGMPLFMHFKDPEKVKSKKRWSQCMYMNYVLKYKTLTANNSRKFGNIATSYSAVENHTLWEYSSNNVKGNTETEEINCPNDILNRGDEISGTKISPRLKNSVYLEDDDEGFVSGSLTPTISHCTSVATLQSCYVNDVVEGSDTITSLAAVEAEAVVDEYPGIINISYLFDEVDDTPATGDSCTTQTSKTHGSYDLWPSSATECHGIHLQMNAAVDDDHTYILATDADMDFKDDAVLDLLRMCNSDQRIGGACGRTHPDGKHRSAMVWHQIFEYAKDFWMIKNSQNVIGSLMCAPGCFSLYRASAIKQVMEEYSSPTLTPLSVYYKDTGEDRWMSTLLMNRGWRLRYSAFADNTTYCPDNIDEFLKQRRRWLLSDIANTLCVAQNLIPLIRNNDCFTTVYVVYLINLFILNIVNPGTTIVMIAGALEVSFDIPYISTAIPLTIIVFIYAIICTQTSSSTQIKITTVVGALMGCLFALAAAAGAYLIVVDMIHDVSVGTFRLHEYYIILLIVGSFIYSALLHPTESYLIVYSLAYLFIFPATHVLLPIYSVANIIDQSWGTRDKTKAKIPKLSCFRGLKRKRKNKRKKKGDMGSDADISEAIKSLTRDITECDEEGRMENVFWEDLMRRLIGKDTNNGLEAVELAGRLRSLRNKNLVGLLIVNALWLILLSFIYKGFGSQTSRLEFYGVMVGVLYGFTFIVQVVGLTICRVNQVLRRIARYVNGGEKTMWVNSKHAKP